MKLLFIAISFLVALSTTISAQNANRSGVFMEIQGGVALGDVLQYRIGTNHIDDVLYYKLGYSFYSTYLKGGVTTSLDFGYRWTTSNHLSLDAKIGVNANLAEFKYTYNWSVPTTVNVESLEEIGGTELDNATNLLGPGWRTPSKLEFNELKSKCRWNPINYKGTDGALITGPSGKAIFLPENYYWLSNAPYRSFYFDDYWIDDVGHFLSSSNNSHSFDKFYIRPVYGPLK
jgi:non-specific serine/threonine protein kinase